MKMKPVLALALLFLGGCADNSPVKTQASPVTLKTEAQSARQQSTTPYTESSLSKQQPIGKPQDALQILYDEGLAGTDDYSDAQFIPNSNDAMIVATLRSVPCKMIFRFVTTSNARYWMPNQIDCENRERMPAYTGAGEEISSASPPMINSIEGDNSLKSATGGS